MLNHGISTGGLFLLVGMIYERRHTREITDFGGITKVMPLFAVAFMIMTLSSVALPGTNGFIGEFLILLGSWKANPGLTVIASLGVVFGAVYMLWMFQRVMFGPITHKENEGLHDLTGREKLVLAPLIVAIFAMGIFPNFFFDKMNPSIDRFLARTNSAPTTTATAVAQAGYRQVSALGEGK
jgi:NADH-quinone oxidoreductase subunit M